MRGPRCITVPMCTFCMFHVCLLCVSVVAIDRCLSSISRCVCQPVSFSLVCSLYVSCVSTCVCSCVLMHMSVLCVCLSTGVVCLCVWWLFPCGMLWCM